MRSHGHGGFTYLEINLAIKLSAIKLNAAVMPIMLNGSTRLVLASKIDHLTSVRCAFQSRLMIALETFAMCTLSSSLRQILGLHWRWSCLLNNTTFLLSAPYWIYTNPKIASHFYFVSAFSHPPPLLPSSHRSGIHHIHTVILTSVKFGEQRQLSPRPPPPFIPCPPLRN